jgi:aryl-alcohol dehydrogenase-like predicted oxidoreductase
LRIGLSVSGPRQADTIWRALALRRDGVQVFDAVQATWNVLERSAGPALAEAHAAGWGVIVKEAIANGRLGPRDSSPTLQSFRAMAAELATGPDVLAMAAVLAQPWAGVVLSGAATVEQLEANLRAREVVWDTGLEERLAGLSEPPGPYWAARGELAWT